jgi:hypothetical protein
MKYGLPASSFCGAQPPGAVTVDGGALTGTAVNVSKSAVSQTLRLIELRLTGQPLRAHIQVWTRSEIEQNRPDLFLEPVAGIPRSDANIVELHVMRLPGP